MQKIVQGLSELLADTYLVYLKTQNFHWNVRGPYFYSLHKMFEEQYNELALASDTIAERIRALNAFAPASFAEFLKLTSLKESRHDLPAEGMIKALLKDHEILHKTCMKLFKAAQQAQDEVTVDLLLKRMDVHDKTAWMLRSHLGKM